MAKGSLAKEGNSFNFLSHLVRTSLACSMSRVPHLKSVRCTRRRGPRAAEKHATSPGLECFHGKVSHARAEKCQARSAKETLPCCWIFSATQGTRSFSSVSCPGSHWAGGQSPTRLPARSSRQRTRVEPGPAGTRHVPSTAAHLSQLLKPPRLLPPVSKKSLLHSLTHAHTPQVLHHKLVQK